MVQIKAVPSPMETISMPVWLLGRYRFASPCRQTKLQEEGKNRLTVHVSIAAIPVNIKKSYHNAETKYNSFLPLSQLQVGKREYECEYQRIDQPLIRIPDQRMFK